MNLVSTLAASTITAIRHWLVHLPLTAPIVWGSRAPFPAPSGWGPASRPGPPRLVVEITTSGGVRGYGETICLLDSIEPVLVNVAMPLALNKGVHQAENSARHAPAAGAH